MKRLAWKPEKNEWLKAEREISFEQIEAAIDAGGFRGAYKYKGTKKIHANQLVWIVEVDGEEWRVPVTITETVIIARTAYQVEE